MSGVQPRRRFFSLVKERERRSLPRSRELSPRSLRPRAVIVFGLLLPTGGGSAERALGGKGLEAASGARLVGACLQQQRDDLNAVAGGCNVQRGGASETGWRRRVGAGGLEGHAERGGRREEEERGRRGCSRSPEKKASGENGRKRWRKEERNIKMVRTLEPERARASKRKAAEAHAGRPGRRSFEHPGWPCRGAQGLTRCLRAGASGLQTYKQHRIKLPASRCQGAWFLQCPPAACHACSVCPFFRGI